MSFPRLSRTLLGTAAIGALAAPLLVSTGASGFVLSASTSNDRVTAAAKRSVIAPNVAFPVDSAKAVDTNLFGKRNGTEITAPCGTPVVAAHAGTVLVSSSPTSGPNLVRVVTSKAKLVSYYGYMSSASVTHGQIVAAGQVLGAVGKEGIAKGCSLYFAMTRGESGVIKINPTRWLLNYVGKQVPQASLFDNYGFLVASFNVLGASHTPSKKYPGYAARTPKQVTMLKQYGVDVVGLQEFERKQRDLFLKTAAGTYGIYPSVSSKNSANSIIWNKSTMDFVSASTIGVPYFRGNIKQMPVVLLRHKATGREAYFINVHNPASIPKYGDQSKWRRQAIAIEKAKVVELRKTGKAVFLTGDLNDRTAAFCPLTAGKLMISGNSVPSMTCDPPKSLWIDWIFGAGPVRFTTYVKDMKPKNARWSDHPIILSRAYLAPDAR